MGGLKKLKIMGKPKKTNTPSYNKKNKTNEFAFLVRELKKKYPTAINIEVYYKQQKPIGFNFRIEPNGELKKIRFTK